MSMDTPVSSVNAAALTDELFAKAMEANGSSFTIIKQLGTVKYSVDQDGNAGPDWNPNDRAVLEMNAAAVRILADRFPDLKIKYPQTVISEETVSNGDQTLCFSTSRTDAVIEVPETFVQLHCGTAFQTILHEKWEEQYQDFAKQIVSRLRKHEMRTEKLFGTHPEAASLSFRVTEDYAESDIWSVALAQCGLYPLQWDGEICGMSLMLAAYLKDALADDCTEPPTVSVLRDAEQKLCTVTVYYSLKQD